MKITFENYWKYIIGRQGHIIFFHVHIDLDLYEYIVLRMIVFNFGFELTIGGLK